MGSKKTVTLIELLIAIAISSLLGVTVVFMLSNCLDAYMFTEEHALMQKIIDDTLEEISGDKFDHYGIKDALEITEARPDQISFLCLWVDEYPYAGRKKQFELTHPFRAGASLPIMEVKPFQDGKFRPVSISFTSSQDIPEAKRDIVVPNSPLPPRTEVRIIYEPDYSKAPETVMTIQWDTTIKRFRRIYNNKLDYFPKVTYGKDFWLSDIKFEYYDNTNSILPSPVPPELLSSISAVRVSLRVETKDPHRIREGSAFVTLRNTRMAGNGIVLREGTRVRIPDSYSVKTFSIGNVVGVGKGDVLILKAIPEKGKSWRITLYFDVRNNLPLIKRYSIEYPAGVVVYSEDVSHSLDLPFDLLSIGKNGRYDYDFDKDVTNLVKLKGRVTLEVEKMTISGAGLFVRP